MGKPVALDARAEERDTRGFISTTSMVPSAGFTANWMLQPPASTPISRMMAMAASRMVWYSASDRVWAGATVTESPVCTPIGSKFSTEHTTITLSAPSLTTSSSYSFQPRTPRSISTSPLRLASSPFRTCASNSAKLYAVPPPVPPSVKDGRTIAG